MEKRTILAVVLSTVVILAFWLAQGIFAPQSQPQAPVQVSSGAAPGQPTPAEGEAPAAVPEAAPAGQSPAAEQSPAEEEIRAQPPVIIETDLIRAALSNTGGDIISYQLKGHRDQENPVEMIFPGNSEPRTFSVTFGNKDDLLSGRVRPVDAFFKPKKITDLIWEFSRDFSSPQGGRFTMTKRYEFKPGEYLFELNIFLDGGHSVQRFDFNGAAYTLAFGPQIGPRFEKLDSRYEYRNYLSYKGKLKTEKVNDREPSAITPQPSWGAIAGKYFTLIALPYVNQFDMFFSTQAEPGLPSASRLLISRPVSNGSRVEDKYQFYLGPKNQESLAIYDNGNNSWKLNGAGLIEVANTRGFLAPLEWILKWFLTLFYKFIPNYGVAIILVTLLVKLIMFPLTKKSSESTMRMQTLAPKVKEIQEKYKDNPQKMNTEMAAFYKKEGYNPLSGCLPMLIQIPIFFAMYNLFNNHFDLRGAMFIPGWIPDLSRPESVLHFERFTVPFLGWTDLRLLPFIYVGSQLLYGKVTQTPDQKGNAQMKLMLYAMPIIFFFILYDVPSGLLLYWIMSNVLTMVQQVSINKYLARKKAAAGIPEPVIAPKKRKKTNSRFL
ncbi:MAG: membrane protein insertase YidC [Treponema sp.]|jgi:YidC/Oxa1 family membrane protein insertase|nr:membrane protein insertase YidC [Treponema sp.]